MADNTDQALEGKEAAVQDAPPPKEERKAEPALDVTALPITSDDEERVDAENGAQVAIRNVFVARIAASSEASIGSFAQIETSEDGLAVRGAYVAHLAVAEPEAVPADTSGSGDLLRSVYLERAMADAMARPRPEQRATRPTKRSAAGPRKKAPKAKARVARTTSAKKVSAASARAKPRGAAGRAAARTGRRGKRRGR